MPESVSNKLPVAKEIEEQNQLHLVEKFEIRCCD